VSATARRAGLAIYRHHAAEPGGATRVVFVHGSLDRGAAFLRTARLLREHDVVRYDRRGYGRSAEAGTSVGIDAMVADLVVVLDGQPSVVVGHSLGGVIALAAAQHHPHLVTAVATFEAPSPWLDWWPGRSAGGRALEFADRGPEEVAERFLRGLVGSERWEALPEATKAARRREGPALVADLTAIRGDEPYSTGQLVALGLPVVTGYGSLSKPHHVRSASDLHDAVPGSELVVIDGASHDAHASHPDEFARFVGVAIRRARSLSP
jgi:pimeloyl-ACP methyl ester carboxylesterase